jgi:DNA-directed RNA polymerase beta subunit
MDQNMMNSDGGNDKHMGVEDDITQEDAWAVIKSYFEQHGLVSQQISSFDRFLSYTIQDIVTENSVISIIPEKQYAPGSKLLTINLYSDN